MKFIDWIYSFFGVDKATVYLTDQATKLEQQLAIEIFAIHSAINLIASSVSKCEFKKYSKGIENKANEYICGILNQIKIKIPVSFCKSSYLNYYLIMSA